MAIVVGSALGLLDGEIKGELYFGFTAGIISLSLGTYCLVTSFIKEKNFRVTEDIPTSKITTDAVGHNVEVHARIFCRPEDEIVAPLSEEKCGFVYLQMVIAQTPSPVSKLSMSQRVKSWALALIALPKME